MDFFFFTVIYLQTYFQYFCFQKKSLYVPKKKIFNNFNTFMLDASG
jgi:hypothetical protein